ncbi:MAG: ATP-binding protein [Chitinophagaceae bacterium]
MLKKIVAIGPESTGKSRLCEQLARHYGTVWCPEYAREYLLKHGTGYSYEDLLTIAKGQLALEEEQVRIAQTLSTTQHSSSPVSSSSGLLFIDTDMYVMKVWCEFVFGNCHRFILDQVVERKYDLYLLCNIDLPWVRDELREYPDPEPRRQLYSIYRDILVNQAVPWVEISGNYEERVAKAVQAVNNIL